MKKVQKTNNSKIIIGAVVAGVILLSGTAVAADNSKPGDALYGIDRGLESVQMTVAVTDQMKEDLHSTLAAERLQEIQALYKEGDIKAEDIDDALEDYNEHKSELERLSNKDGVIDEHEKSLSHSVEEQKTAADKTAETAQKNIENERESLKKQYEQAKENGDTTTAEALKVQVEATEEQLKTVEQDRETQKQQAEKAAEAEKKANE